MKDDQRFMALALEQARQAYQAGEVPIGAVLTIRGRVIAQDHNRTEELEDPTAHAEILCLSAATAFLRSKYLRSATLYVTLEPCPMCAGALAWAQIGRLVYAAPDPERGFTRYQPGLLHPRTRWEQGPFAEEALALLQHFFRTKRRSTSRN
ncbi:MAG: tRNA-specific adenosine deaminase [Bacteroidia bacterium]|nr:MAG: tRNA-specific adenosine deaminase [Bacteroidia bacterium]